jgi:hypothetical protein
LQARLERERQEKVQKLMKMMQDHEKVKQVDVVDGKLELIGFVFRLLLLLPEATTTIAAPKRGKTTPLKASLTARENHAKPKGKKGKKRKESEEKSKIKEETEKDCLFFDKKKSKR